MVKGHPGKPLGRDFYCRPTIAVAVGLLGKVLHHKTTLGSLAGKIAEVEAYLGRIDPACHAFSGKTRRTSIFWGMPGMAYVFVNYGIHHCLNAITEKLDVAGCVLIRALEPIVGIEAMMKNRSVGKLISLTNGPAKLTQALGITLDQNGTDLTQGDLVILDDDQCSEILVTGRIGISKAQNEPLRFCIEGNSFVSPHSSKVVTVFQGGPDKVWKSFLDGTIRIGLEEQLGPFQQSLLEYNKKGGRSASLCRRSSES